MTSRIELYELPARMWMLAEDMTAVGAAISYYCGFGPFAEWGALLQEQSAPMCREIAEALERIQGARV